MKPSGIAQLSQHVEHVALAAFNPCRTVVARGGLHDTVEGICGTVHAQHLPGARHRRLDTEAAAVAEQIEYPGLARPRGNEGTRGVGQPQQKRERGPVPPVAGRPRWPDEGRLGRA